jgi:putative membrane protein
MMARLEGIPAGGGFDRMYVRGQSRGHRELLNLNSSYLRAGSDPKLQSVAEMSVPIIHLAILRNLKEMA